MMILSKGGISYDVGLMMEEEERHGAIIALREANGFTYLGNGKWRKPKWMVEQERRQDEARRARSF
jgi:hypothetical protein